MVAATTGRPQSQGGNSGEGRGNSSRVVAAVVEAAAAVAAASAVAEAAVTAAMEAGGGGADGEDCARMAVRCRKTAVTGEKKKK